MLLCAFSFSEANYSAKSVNWQLPPSPPCKSAKFVQICGKYVFNLCISPISFNSRLITKSGKCRGGSMYPPSRTRHHFRLSSLSTPICIISFYSFRYFVIEFHHFMSFLRFPIIFLLKFIANWFFCNNFAATFRRK
jgi:hypothetical protein